MTSKPPVSREARGGLSAQELYKRSVTLLRVFDYYFVTRTCRPRVRRANRANN